MKKNLLLSLVAMSAPMVAFADANISDQLNVGVDQWAEQGKGVTLDADGVFNSPFGAPLNQTVKNLLPGKYIFTVGQTDANAKVVIGGVEVKDGEAVVELKSQQDVAISVTSVNSGSFKVGKFGLKLEFDFKAEGQKLSDKALLDFGNLKKVGPLDSKALSEECSRISNDILKVMNATEEDGYNVYADFELWKPSNESNLWKQIDDQKAKVNQAAENFAVYNAAKAVLEAANDAVAAVNWHDGAPYYAADKSPRKVEFKGVKADIEAKFANVEDYQSATYTADFEKGKLDGYLKGWQKQLNELQGRIDADKANDEAYNAVVEARKAVTAAYMAAQKQFADEMKANAGADKNVYEAMQKEANDKLAKAYDLVANVAFNELLGNAFNPETGEGRHDEAKDNKSDLDQKVLDAKNGIKAVVKEYIGDSKDGLYYKEFNAYAKVVGDVKVKLQDVLNGITKESVYEGERAGLQQQINDLLNLINADNEKYQVHTKDYSISDVETAINDFGTKADADFQNKKAWNGLVAAFAQFDKDIEAAKKVVAGYEVKDGKNVVYKAVDYNNLNDVDVKIAALRKAHLCEVGGAYDSQKSYTVLSVAEKQAVADLLDNYKTYAKTSRDQYETVYKQVAADKASLAKLEKTISGYGSVPVVAEPGKTYDDKVKEFQDNITKADNALAAACEKSNLEHKVALNAVSYAGQAIDATEATFEADKATALGDIKLDTARKLRDEAVNQIAEVNAQAEDLKTLLGEGTVGNNKEDYENTLETYQGQIGELDKKVEVYKKSGDTDPIVKDNSAEASAVLDQIKADLNKVSVDISELNTKVSARIAHVQANTAKWDALNAAKGDLTVLKNTIASILNEYKDANRKAEFEKLHKEVNDAYDKLYKAAEASKTAENLVNDWDNGKVVSKDKREEAYSKTCADLQKKAEGYVAQAKACAANRFAYDGDKTPSNNDCGVKKSADYVNMNTYNANAVAALNKIYGAEPVYADAKKHYTDALTALSTKYGDIVAAVEKSYKGRTMVDDKAGHLASLAQCRLDVNNVPVDANNNKVAYIALVGDKYSKRVHAEWDAAYLKISTSDKTPERDGFLQKLTDQQKALDILDVKVTNDLAAGLCDDNAAALQNEYNAISQAVASILQQQQEGYDQAVDKANTEYSNKINAEYDEALTVYKEGAKTINLYNNVQNVALRNDLAVLTAGVDLYPYMQKITEEKAKFNADYTEWLKEHPNEVFEYPSEASWEAAVALTGEVTKVINELRTKAVLGDGKDVKGAKTLLGAAHAYAEGQLSIYDGKIATYHQSVKDKAYSELRENVNGAKDLLVKMEKVTDASLAEEDYVLTLDDAKYLDNLATTFVDNYLGEQLDLNVVAEWTVTVDEYEGKFTADKYALAGFNYPINYNQYHYYINSYNQAYKDNFVPVKDDALYNLNYGNLNAYVSAAEQAYTNVHAIYLSAETLCVQTRQSDANYKLLVEGLNGEGELVFMANYNAIDAAYEDLKAYVKPYMIALESNWLKTVSAYEEGQQQKRQYIDNAQLWGSVFIAPGDLDVAKNDLEAVYANVTVNFASQADGLQKAALDREIKKLKQEVNTAVAEKGDFDYTGFSKRIAELEARYNTKAADVKDLHQHYIDLQKDIATCLQDIRNGYDKGQQGVNALKAELEKSIQNLIASRDQLAAKLGEVYSPVKAQYEGQFEQVKVQIADVESAYKEYAGNFSLLEKNLKYMIGETQGNLDDVTVAVNDLQAKYQTHINVVDGLQKELTGLVNRLETVYGEIKDYKSVTDYQYDYSREYQDIMDYYVAPEQAILEAAQYKEGVAITEFYTTDATFEYDIKSQIDDLEKTAANNEFNYLYKNLATSVQLENVAEGWNLIAEDQKTHGDEQQKLNKLYNALEYFHYQAYNNQQTRYDIEGNFVGWTQPDYLESYKSCFEQLKKLDAETQTLKDQIADHKILPGDTDNDGSILANDYMTVLNYVLSEQVELTTVELKREFARCNVYGDDQVNIGDVVKVTNIIRGVGAKAALFAHPLSMQARQNDNIALSVEGEGTTRRIAINLNNSTSYVGGQMDIKLPAGVTLMNESLGSRAGSHDINSADMGNGVHRVIVSSINNDELVGGEGAVLYLDVEVSHSYNGEGIEVSNVMFADPAARVYHLNSLNGGEATGVGTVTLTQELKSKVYNIGGQLMNNLKKGVNIIKMSDGSVKKVIKK